MPTTPTKDRLALGRGDYWLVRVLAILVAAGIVGYNLIAPLMSWLTNGPVIWSAGLVDDVTAPSTTPGVDGRYDRIAWTIHHPDAAQRIGSFLPGLLATAAVVVCCVALWRLLRRAQAGTPFTPASVRALRTLGITVVAWAILAPPVTALASVLVVVGAAEGVAWFFTTADIASWIAVCVAGLLMVVIADVFRRGIQLEADVEGLV